MPSATIKPFVFCALRALGVIVVEEEDEEEEKEDEEEDVMGGCKWFLDVLGCLCSEEEEGQLCRDVSDDAIDVDENSEGDEDSEPLDEPEDDEDGVLRNVSMASSSASVGFMGNPPCGAGRRGGKGRGNGCLGRRVQNLTVGGCCLC